VQIPYETVVKNVESREKGGVDKIITPGVNGIKRITYKVKYQANEVIDKIELSSVTIKEPVSKVVEVKTVLSRSSSVARTGNGDASKLSTMVAGIEPVTRTLNASSYDACVACCGKTNGITSSGAKATPWYTVAAGRGLPIGTIIYIPSLASKPNGGWFIVQDRGGAISDSKIDIYVSTHSEALKFGRKNLKAYIYFR
jgi:3D (Asp-Asp-Asp) domain-containing protein